MVMVVLIHQHELTHNPIQDPADQPANTNLDTSQSRLPIFISAHIEGSHMHVDIGHIHCHINWSVQVNPETIQYPDLIDH